VSWRYGRQGTAPPDVEAPRTHDWSASPPALGHCRMLIDDGCGPTWSEDNVTPALNQGIGTAYIRHGRLPPTANRHASEGAVLPEIRRQTRMARKLRSKKGLKDNLRPARQSWTRAVNGPRSRMRSFCRRFSLRGTGEG